MPSNKKVRCVHNGLVNDSCMLLKIVNELAYRNVSLVIRVQ